MRRRCLPDGQSLDNFYLARRRRRRRFSWICSATTRATSRSIRLFRITFARTSRRFLRCGARTTRSSCRREPRPSSATFPVQSSASSTPAISRWKRMPGKSAGRYPRLPRLTRQLTVSRQQEISHDEVSRDRHRRQPGHRTFNCHPSRQAIFPSITLAARGRENLEETAAGVRAARRRAAGDRYRSCRRRRRRRESSIRRSPRRRPDRRPAQYRGSRAADRSFRDDRPAMGGRLALKLHGARRLDHRCLAGAEGGPRLGRPDVGQFGALPRRRPTPPSARSTPRSSPSPRHFPIAASPMASRSTASCPAPS